VAGFSKVYSAHSKGIAAFAALYSLLFMYFQQTLLVDGLSFTSSGPFNIRLPVGESVIVSTVPPIPSGMPFPLWGPFLFITTNFFDLAVTPLSLGLTLVISVLVSFVVFFYIDFYQAVKRGSAGSGEAAYAQTVSFAGTLLSCSCEFFEGLFAAIEPASATVWISKILDFVAVVVAVVMLAALVIGVYRIVLDLRLLVTSLTFDTGAKNFVIDSLTMFVIFELLLGFMQYHGQSRISPLYILDAGLFFTTRELMIELYTGSISAIALVAFGAVIAAIGYVRVVMSRGQKGVHEIQERTQSEELPADASKGKREAKA
jgi:uncharacterized membrane protein (DUF373 family)